MKSNFKWLAIAATAASVGTFALPAHAADVPVYVESLQSAVNIDAIATSGDQFGSYIFPGIPDGSGAIKDGNTLRIFTNSEQSYNATSALLQRAGGTAQGSTVSEIDLDLTTRKVTNIKELLTKVTYWDYSTKQFASKPVAPEGATATDSYGTPLHGTYLARFCSASLSPAGRLSYKSGKTTYGISDAIFLNGEESGDEGRAFVTNTAGQMVHMPKFGLASWETFNVVPTSSKVTAVIGNEDNGATNSQISMYVGTKTATGAWYEKAGFTNGTRYIMNFGYNATEAEFRSTIGKNKETPVSFREVNTEVNGVAQNNYALTLGTALARVEDGSFDPNHPNDYYFVTTESNKNAGATAVDPSMPTQSRDGGALWRIRFKDVKNPMAGATVTMLLDGSEAPYMNKPDNIEVDGFGNILIQEDPGNQPIRTRIFSYRISDGKIAVLSQFKKQYFEPGQDQFITQDEETSGIFNATQWLKKSKTDTNKYYIFVAQVHSSTLLARPDLISQSAKDAAATAIEGGQVYIMTVSDWAKVYN